MLPEETRTERSLDLVRTAEGMTTPHTKKNKNKDLKTEARHVSKPPGETQTERSSNPVRTAEYMTASQTELKKEVRHTQLDMTGITNRIEIK